MLLHRYFGSHAFETLKEAKLKTARISSFNDPFEFLYVGHFEPMTAERARKYIRAQRKSPATLLLLGLTNRISVNPLSEKTIKKRLDANEPTMVARLVEKWPEIAEKSKMSFERQREILDTELRAVCLSDESKVEPLDDILLWSHYANKHKGIRIGFEFPEGIKEPFEIFPMVYQKNRVKVNLSFWENVELVGKELEECAVQRERVKHGDMNTNSGC
jgi:hypothetical protein